jgi:hypothetical protein
MIRLVAFLDVHAYLCFKHLVRKVVVIMVQINGHGITQIKAESSLGNDSCVVRDFSVCNTLGGSQSRPTIVTIAEL